jgi:hypothetical protein
MVEGPDRPGRGAGIAPDPTDPAASGHDGRVDGVVLLLALSVAGVLGLGIAITTIVHRRDHERVGLFGTERASAVREREGVERVARARATAERADRLDRVVATAARLRFAGVTLTDADEPQPGWGLLRFDDGTGLLIHLRDPGAVGRLRRAARWGPVVVGTAEVVPGGVWLQLWSRSGPVDLVALEVSILGP